jgi:hypothetical protein
VLANAGVNSTVLGMDVPAIGAERRVEQSRAGRGVRGDPQRQLQVPRSVVEATAMGEVERRWAGRFFQPLTAEAIERAQRLQHLLALPPGSEEFVASILAGEDVPMTTDLELAMVLHLRSVLARNGNGLSIVERPGGAVVRLHGKVAPGLPEYTWLAHSSLATPSVVRAAAVFIEVLPPGATDTQLAMAFELLGPAPTDVDALELSDYDAPLTGRFSEWVEGGRAILELSGIADAA